MLVTFLVPKISTTTTNTITQCKALNDPKTIFPGSNRTDHLASAETCNAVSAPR